MQSTNGFSSDISDITLSGESSAYFDTLLASTISASDLFLPRINPILTTLLGSTINVPTLIQNLEFDSVTRCFNIWDDLATGQMFIVDASNNIIQLQSINTLISSNFLQITAVSTFQNNVIIPRVNPNLITLLGSTINLTNLCQNLNFDTINKSFEIWDNNATGQMFIVDVSNNIIQLQSINTLISSNFLQITAVSTVDNDITFTANSDITLLGNILANSLTITPLEFSRLDGIAVNIQAGLNNRGLLNGVNTWTGATNTFSNTVVFNGTSNFNGACNVTTQPDNTNDNTAVSSAYLFNIIRSDGTTRNVSAGVDANPNNRGANNFSLGQGVMENLPALTTTSDNVGIGINALNGCTQGYYCFAQGGGSLQFMTTGQRNVAIGYATFPNANPFNSICIGSNSGNASSGYDNIIFGVFTANALTSGSYNFICGSGSGTDLSTGDKNIICGYGAGGGIISGNNNTMIGSASSASGDFSESTALGYGAVINANNEIALGRSTETIKIYGNLVTNGTTTSTGIITANAGITSTGVITANAGIVNNGSISSTGIITANGGITNINGMNIFSCSTLQTGAFTISSPYFYIYPVAPTATQTITLPTPAVGLLGVTFIIRRTGGTTTVAINSNINIYGLSNGLSTVILGGSAYNTTLTCMYITASTFGWFKTV